MKSIKKLILYIRRHLDFLVLDMVTFALAYMLAVQVRRALKFKITHEDLFVKFGIAALVIYLVVVLVSYNLNGILARSFPREIRAVSLQMISTWSIYTIVLFLLREAHDFSRIIYVLGFCTCSTCLVVVRTIWKGVVKHTGMSKRFSPMVLIVVDRSRAQRVLQGLLSGSYENTYKIVGVVTNESGEDNYNDWYPYYEGFQNISEILLNRHVQDAFVALDDAEEEATVFKMLLDAGVTIHRSLGDSVFGYASEHIDIFGGKAVITIDDTQPSLVSRADRIWREYISKRAKKKGRNQQDS